ncbi:hypothetical protein DVH24_024039 [Malus domestica]|uniref:Uncharacterized protein n=1 Tax=Malus domestica TaxID=3750 RepID=A0A498JHH3_MALDO|nr:hypothetical protein DVH24_024039 [Malus domestica]
MLEQLQRKLLLEGQAAEQDQIGRGMRSSADVWATSAIISFAFLGLNLVATPPPSALEASSSLKAKSTLWAYPKSASCFPEADVVTSSEMVVGEDAEDA